MAVIRCVYTWVDCGDAIQRTVVSAEILPIFEGFDHVADVNLAK